MENALKKIIQKEDDKKYQSFKEFCMLKEKGLRKESFKKLATFINEAKNWDRIAQIDFSCWLFEVFDDSDDIHHVLVHPLEENILKPILEKWMISDPKDARPYKWYGLYLNINNRLKYLKLAFEIDGKKGQQVLLKIIDIYLNELWYAFHHISEDLYLGNLHEDKNLIETIETLITLVEDEELKKDILEESIYYKNLLNDWVCFTNEETKGFVKWCKTKGKEYHRIEAYYYEND